MDHFLSLSNKYICGRLAIMVETGAGPKNIFRQVEHIHISDIQHISIYGNGVR